MRTWFADCGGTETSLFIGEDKVSNIKLFQREAAKTSFNFEEADIFKKRSQAILAPLTRNAFAIIKYLAAIFCFYIPVASL